MSADTNVENVSSNHHLKALVLTALPAVMIGLCILSLGFVVHKNGMNLFELTGSIYDRYYPLILVSYIIILPAFLPFAVKLFRHNRISLLEKLTSKDTFAKDAVWGIAAGISSYAFFFVDVHVMLKMPVEKAGPGSLILLEILSIVIISGILKEIYFRGIPYYIMKGRYGEWKAFLFGNICYTVLDWPNFGLSFFLGLIWYLFFRKRGSLIIPIIGHGLFNLLGVLARAGALSFIGIVPVQESIPL
ncbi:MAG: CPBP family intramembrane glutamic endopeptidase [Chitinispirillaceae bacterium]